MTTRSTRFAGLPLLRIVVTGSACARSTIDGEKLIKIAMNTPLAKRDERGMTALVGVSLPMG
jgi:hypothetical protein